MPLLPSTITAASKILLYQTQQSNSKTSQPFFFFNRWVRNIIWAVLLEIHFPSKKKVSCLLPIFLNNAIIDSCHPSSISWSHFWIFSLWVSMLETSGLRQTVLAINSDCYHWCLNKLQVGNTVPNRYTIVDFHHLLLYLFFFFW